MKINNKTNKFATVEEEVLNSLKIQDSPYSRSLIISCLKSVRNSLQEISDPKINRALCFTLADDALKELNVVFNSLNDFPSFPNSNFLYIFGDEVNGDQDYIYFVKEDHYNDYGYLNMDDHYDELDDLIPKNLIKFGTNCYLYKNKYNQEDLSSELEELGIKKINII